MQKRQDSIKTQQISFSLALDESIISKLIEGQKIKKQEYELQYQDKLYTLKDVTIAKSTMPVNRPTTRGGVYSVSDKEYKIRATIPDLSLVPFISKMMLGPNTEFQEIPITTNIEYEGKLRPLTLFTYLTNAMNNSSKIELNLLVIRTSLG